MSRRTFTAPATALAITLMASSPAAASLSGSPFNAIAYPPIQPVPSTPTRDVRSLPRGAKTVEVDSTRGDSKLELAGGGGRVGALSLPTRYVISTSSGWVSLRSVPGDFAVGLGRDGWGIDVGRYADGYRMGYVTGTSVPNGQPTANTVEKCLWVGDSQASIPTGGAATRDCSAAPSLGPTSYMALFNGNRRGVNCFGEGLSWTCDGTDARINASYCPYGAPVLGNVQPWRPGLGLWGNYGLYTIPPDSVVKWRYVTKDYQFAMIRNPGSVAQGGPRQDWGFIPSICLAGNFGYNELPPR